MFFSILSRDLYRWQILRFIENRARGIIDATGNRSPNEYIISALLSDFAHRAWPDTKHHQHVLPAVKYLHPR